MKTFANAEAALAYFTEIHLATEEGAQMLKKTSKSELERLKNISDAMVQAVRSTMIMAPGSIKWAPECYGANVLHVKQENGHWETCPRLGERLKDLAPQHQLRCDWWGYEGNGPQCTCRDVKIRHFPGMTYDRPLCDEHYDIVLRWGR